MKSGFLKVAGMAFLLAGISGVLMAQTDNGWNWNCAPEIDAASAGTAIALLSGAVLMIRSRKK